MAFNYHCRRTIKNRLGLDSAGRHESLGLRGKYVAYSVVGLDLVAYESVGNSNFVVGIAVICLADLSLYLIKKNVVFVVRGLFVYIETVYVLVVCCPACGVNVAVGFGEGKTFDFSRFFVYRVGKLFFLSLIARRVGGGDPESNLGIVVKLVHWESDLELAGISGVAGYLSESFPAAEKRVRFILDLDGIKSCVIGSRNGNDPAFGSYVRAIHWICVVDNGNVLVVLDLAGNRLRFRADVACVVNSLNLVIIGFTVLNVIVIGVDRLHCTLD